MLLWQQCRVSLRRKVRGSAAKRPFREWVQAGGAAARRMILLACCHGSTLDSLDPGSLGHRPPPAVNLPAADCRAPPAGAALRCLAPAAPRPAA
jgi:hypothetical protein